MAGYKVTQISPELRW